MYNKLLSKFQQPAKGWDPVSASYAAKYCQENFDVIDTALLNEFERWSDGFKNKRVVDLGAGPGQYSLEFLKRGAYVTWWDISNRYLQFAENKIKQAGYEASFRLDYMDHLNGSFDIIFNRVCWYYCFNDRSFLKTIYNALEKNGTACLVLHNEYRVFQNNLPLFRKLILWTTFYLNEWFNFKIGHVMPSKKKIRKLFSAYTFQQITIREYGNNNDSTLVLIKK